MSAAEPQISHEIDEAAEDDARAVWSWNRQRLALIAAASIALLALIALVSVIDLPDLRRDNEQKTTAASGLGPGNGPNSGGLSSGGNGSGRIDLGDGSGLDVRPIPGCPNGFAIGDDILVIPDPEACGYQPIPPGAQGFEPSGKTILVPSLDGEIGGFRLGPDGEVSLVAPGELQNNDVVVGQFSDGTFGVFRADGSWVEITPGDDGLSFRDPLSGDSFFVPDDGEPFSIGSDQSQNGDLGVQDPGAQDPAAQDPAAQDPGAQDPAAQDPSAPENSDSSDSSEPSDADSPAGPTALWLLLALLAIGLIALAVYGTRGASFGGPIDEHEIDPDEPGQDTLADYSAELNALDRMLWEIDQEADPRTAIRRVYAALETGLDNPAMARRRAETPGIYLGRVLGSFDALQTPLRELIDLFEQARFSEHDITSDMRDRAVYALLAVRGHYAHAATQSAVIESAAS